MSENQVITVGGEKFTLSPPFLVIATQNPVDFHGTYPLPEAQLDRFAIQFGLDYPDLEAELAMLNLQKKDHNPLDDIKPVISCDEIRKMQELVRHVEIEESVSRYLLAIIRSTREDGRLRPGASPRSSLMISRAQAIAFLSNRNSVIPDDVQKIVIPVLAHRIMLSNQTMHSGTTKVEIITDIVNKTKHPSKGNLCFIL